MKIISNQEKKSPFSNKKVIAAVSSVAGILVICVGVLVFIGAGKADTINVDFSESVESVDPVDTVKPDGNRMSLDFVSVSDEKVDLTDPDVDLYAQDVIDSTGGWVAASTGIITNRDELIQTVIDAVNGAKVSVAEVEVEAMTGDAPKESDDHNETSKIRGNITAVVIPALLEKVRDKNADLDEQFMIEGSNGEKRSPFLESSEVWGYTYNMWASILGNYVYRHPEGVTFNEYAGASNGVYHGMIAYDVFDFDMSNATNWQVNGVSDTYFVEHMQIHWKIEFTYEKNVYVALLGILDGEYSVIDIVLKGDPDTAWVNDVVIHPTVQPTTEPAKLDTKNSTPDANGSGSEVSIPDDDSSLGGAVKQDPGRQEIPGTGGNHEVPCSGLIVPDPNKDPDAFKNNGYDPENPHPIPGMG